VGIATPAKPALFFCALTYGEEGVARAAGAELNNILGAAAIDMAPFPFSFTNYYEEEMGTGLWKAVRIFSAPRDPQDLAEIKLQTNAIEAALAAPGGKRRVNLDPGYLTLAKVVLATTKDFSHRIYLRGGVYAEVTLSARDGAFQPHPWTYPDYRQESVRQFFWKARNLLAVQRAEK
jgi:hypothetical protein